MSRLTDATRARARGGKAGRVVQVWATSHTYFLYLILMAIGVPKAYRLPYYAPYSSRST